MCLAGAGWGATGLRSCFPLPVAFRYSLAFQRNGGPRPAEGGAQPFAPAAPPARRTRVGPGGRYRSAEPRTARRGAPGAAVEIKSSVKSGSAARTLPSLGGVRSSGARLCAHTAAGTHAHSERLVLGPGPAALPPRDAGPGLRRGAAGSEVWPRTKRCGVERTEGKLWRRCCGRGLGAPAAPALRFVSLFLPMSFFSSCCLLNFLLSLFSFTSFLFSLAFSGASFLSFPFSFSLFSVLSLIPFF